MTYCDGDKCVVPVEVDSNETTITFKTSNKELKEFAQAILTTVMKEMQVRGHITGWRYGT